MPSEGPHLVILEEARIPWPEESQGFPPARLI
jgi:hypothetical protein